MRHTLIILLVLGSFCFGQSSATTSYDELFKTKTTRFYDGTTLKTTYDPLFNTSKTIISPPKSDTKKYWEID